MSIKPEQVYFESIKNLVRDSHELLNDYINEPSFDDKGELINIPHEKFLSHITQALILTRHYKFIESQSDNSIFRAFSKLRDSTFDESNQQERVTNLIQLLDAIVRQIESGILYFSAGTLHAPAQGSLAQIISTPLLFIENPLRDSISSDISELVVATQSRQYKCIALLAGSIAESVLLGIAKLNPSISQTYLQNPSVKGLKKTFPESCGIRELEYICRTAGIITDSTEFAGILSDYRDHIHPNKHITSQTDLDDDDISIILGAMGKLLHNLNNSDQKGLMRQYKEKRLGD